MNEDGIKLLRECNSGCKNATDSMEQILPYIGDSGLKKLVEDYNRKHIKIGDECQKLLNDHGEDEKDPPKVTKAMAWFGTELKLAFDDSSEKISDMLVDGCNMGIKGLSKNYNRYSKAESEVRDIVFELINIEQDFMNELLAFL